MIILFVSHTDSAKMERLITADEISERLYYMVGHLKTGHTCHFTVVPLHNQFKIVGTFKNMPNMSTFTIDLVLEFARKTVDEDLPGVLLTMKENFYKFIKTIYKYSAPFEQFTSQSSFYSTTQTNIRLLETVLPPKENPNPLLPLFEVGPSTSQEGLLLNPPIRTTQTPIYAQQSAPLMPPPKQIPPLPPIIPRPYDPTTKRRKRPSSPSDFINIDGTDHS